MARFYFTSQEIQIHRNQIGEAFSCSGLVLKPFQPSFVSIHFDDTHTHARAHAHNDKEVELLFNWKTPLDGIKRRIKCLSWPYCCLQIQVNFSFVHTFVYFKCDVQIVFNGNVFFRICVNKSR